MSERILSVIAGLLAALVLGLALFWHPDLPELPLPRAAMPEGGDFTLQSADGPVALKDFRGKVVLLYFGYTYCPDICPTSLAATADGLKELKPDELARVAVILISVDPKRDTPARLKEYARFFHPVFVGDWSAEASPRSLPRPSTPSRRLRRPATATSWIIRRTLCRRPGRQLVGRIAHATRRTRWLPNPQIFTNLKETSP
jgi:protein SCO1/2